MTRLRPASILASFFACFASALPLFGEDAQGPPPTSSAVQTILVAKCGRCHGETAKKANLSFADAAAMQKGGESGPIVLPGQPHESLLVEMVVSGQMPPDGENPLDEAELTAIEKWIAAGADFETNISQAALTDHDAIPILLLHCAVCHGRTRREAGLDVRSRDALLAGGKSGPAIVAGDVQGSLLLKRVHAGEMPPKTELIDAMVKPLEPVGIETLSRWIAEGALAAPPVSDVAGTANDPLVSAEDRDFWSFQAPVKSPLPIDSPNASLRSPIDAFLHSALAERGLTFSPEAETLTLLRRVTYDLTGLPPEPSEAEAFLAEVLTEQRPDAYERLVDRLLASPAYGERWGRHWLDVAGYADSEGKREQHLPRPFAWRYRDYVIRAIAADKPYDQFLTEQIAGDELHDFKNLEEITAEQADALAATAFLRLAPDPTWANLTGFTPDRLEVMADSIDVLGSGVMGLSIKCARCHSHKFDPLPQRDYYRLVAIFKGAYDEHDWLKPELQSFGGARSVGLGERYLPYVSSDERRRFEDHNRRLQAEIDRLKEMPASAEVDQQVKALESLKQAEPRVMALWDRGEPSPTYLYRRGDHRQAGAWVEPGPPAALTGTGQHYEPAPPWPGAASTGRRLAFAKWLTSPGQPLTSRVIANRIWKHHFGQGIVRTLGNFGRMGEAPSHPALLDWLACELESGGWNLKPFHRAMVASSAYRQRSSVSEEAARLDPENRWLSRMPLRRLEAEELRDSLLLLSGELDRTRFGPAEAVQVRPDGLVHSGRRRSVYVQQLRKHPPSILDNFDLPAMSPNCLSRSESLVATQALHLLNDDEVRGASRALAARVVALAPAAHADQIDLAYRFALGRPPTNDERELGEESLAALQAEWASVARDVVDAKQQALETYCHAIVNSAAFLYID